jgi:hypothetical protein
MSINVLPSSIHRAVDGIVKTITRSCFCNHKREQCGPHTTGALCNPARSIVLLQYGSVTGNVLRSPPFANWRSKNIWWAGRTLMKHVRQTVGHPWAGYCVMLWQLGRVALTRLTLASYSTQSQTIAVHPPNSWRNNNMLESYWIQSTKVTPLTLSTTVRGI